VHPEIINNRSAENENLQNVVDLNEIVSNELDSINQNIRKYQDLEYSSQVNIPFTHQYYSRFDKNMNRLGTNSHTAAKPFVYHDVAPYYDFKYQKQSLLKGLESWWGRKIWDEHLVQIQGEDYWFTIDPFLDLQVGKDTDANFNTTFN